MRVDVGQLGQLPQGAGQCHQHVLCEDWLRQVLAGLNGLSHLAQVVLVHP